jgi:thiosulfate/3-mercaptopyruvate sulfurtransferase
MTYLRSTLFLLVLMLTACSIVDNQDHAGVIVEADWLQARMDDPFLLLFHVGTEEVFDSVHIPGARFLDPYAFTVSSGDLRNQLPELDSVRNLLNSLGVDRDSRIVLYFESEGLITRTARVFLTLDYAGYGGQSHLLNGGLEGWFAREPEFLSDHVTGERKVRGGKKVMVDKVVAGDQKVTISAEMLDQHRWDPEFVIVDVRSADEYFGEIDSSGLEGSRGHIEGAYAMDYHLLLSESNLQVIKDREELILEFEKAGMDRKKTAVFYCGSGIRASLSYLVAKHLGYPALLYDGSIEEWEELGLPQTSPLIESKLTN